MRKSSMKNNNFSLNYFREGPYKNAKISGLVKYIGKYYWARRFYGKVIAGLTPKGGKILEIGCGFGDLLSFLEKDYQTVGTDVSQDAINQAKKKLKKTELHVLKAEELGQLGRNKFETIVASHLLEHLKNPQIAIELVSALLKENGTFFIVVPNTDSVGRKLKGKNWVGYSDKTHVSLFTPDKWFKLLEHEGFIIEKTFGDGLWDSPYFPYIPEIFQRLFFGLPAIIQTLLTFPFIPNNMGESMVIIAMKN